MRHTYSCRVRWSDVDSYGHVNNVKYFEYFQEARIAFLSGLTEGVPSTPALGFVVARIDVDYLRPILFRTQPYTIDSWVTRVGTSSYELKADIKDGDTVLSRSRTVVVAFDQQGQRARPLSEHERAALHQVCETEAA